MQICLQGQNGVSKLLVPCAYLFLGIMHREILMDISDEEGDRKACIWTVPVLAGMRVIPHDDLSWHLQINSAVYRPSLC